MAEYRELPRVFKLVEKRQDKGHGPKDCDIPADYKLGAGHVKFFYNKLEFLRQRQWSLIEEMKSRGYAPRFHAPDIARFDEHWKNDYEPTPEAMAINKQRIEERS